MDWQEIRSEAWAPDASNDSRVLIWNGHGVLLNRTCTLYADDYVVDIKMVNKQLVIWLSFISLYRISLLRVKGIDVVGIWICSVNRNGFAPIAWQKRFSLGNGSGLLT